MTARSTKSVSLSSSLGVIMPQKLSPSPLSCTHTTIQSISALLTAYAPFYRFSHLILFLIRFPFLYILWSALSFEVVHDENIKKLSYFDSTSPCFPVDAVILPGFRVCVSRLCDRYPIFAAVLTRVGEYARQLSLCHRRDGSKRVSFYFELHIMG